MALITEKRTDIILSYLSDRGYIQYASHYGEPGYQDPENGILLANWNDISERLGDYLENAGFDIQWIDEWIIDYENAKAYRSTADSYHWEPQFIYTECGGMLTPDDDLDEWIEECEITDPSQPIRHCLPSRYDTDEMRDNGYVLVDDDIRCGWYGREDDPATIARKLFARADVVGVVFQMAERGQFEASFKAYCKYEL